MGRLTSSVKRDDVVALAKDVQEFEGHWSIFIVETYDRHTCDTLTNRFNLGNPKDSY
jgi:hypothetical protein